MKNHYQKAADKIIKAVKEITILFAPNSWTFQDIDLRKGKKRILEMLKTNFIPRKKNWE